MGTNSDENTQSVGDSHIAIIGMAGRFPGARTLEEFWQNLREGTESVQRLSDEELLAAGESPSALEDPAYVRAWPVLADIDRFDAGFFGMSPRDAAVMDPQHRFFLEVAWHALENAGYSPSACPASTGVFAACGMNSYMMHHLVRNREVMETVGEWLVRHTGNDMNFLATRISYQLNLKGPSLNVQTACSSALVAVHLGCQSLLNGECDLVLAGASAMSLPQDRGYLYREGEILAPDGHCRPFDTAAGGTLFGSGTGCVVLKRLADALADGDHVLGVIRGSAINNDGSVKVGYLAPSVEGQARAISEALAISGLDARDISYVEAHGTGTAVGDPIEVSALTQAYRAHTDERGYCALGSVKGNIGHLGEAAGMAGLIKTLLAFKHGQLPPSINYTKPNAEIDFPASPFYVNTKLRDWPRGAAPRRAGITALGAGGTNVHLVLEEPPQAQGPSQGRSQQLLVLSAMSSAALEQATVNLARYLSENPELSLVDAAYTLQLGRKHFSHRRALVAQDVTGAIAALKSGDPKQLPTQAHERGTPSVVFMFPGGGAQYATMGAGLYAEEPAYRAAFDECLASLEPALALKVRGLVFAQRGGEATASLELERPSLALPALFAVEYATAKLLMSWGLVPAACIGHSMGEYVAACLSGVFSAAHGMALVATRGRLFETLPEGGMLSVALPESELSALLPGELSIAAVNAASLCVASGPTAAIDALERLLAERGVDTTRIHISVAAHSQMLAPILAEFEAFCRTIRFNAPALPFVSNLTGTWVTPAEATDPAFWVRHLRSTVRFAQGVSEVLQGPERVLLEVGPGRTLASLARQHPSSPAAHPALRHPQEAASDVAFLLRALGKLWLAGVELDFARLHGSRGGRRLPLPGYAFEGRRFWIEADAQAHVVKPNGLRKEARIEDWFHAPSFQRTPVPAPEPKLGPWLVFADSADVAEGIVARLGDARVVVVVPGDSFRKLSDDRYALRTDAPVSYDSLFADLALRELLPRQVVYLWPVTMRAQGWSLRRLKDDSPLEELSRAERTCFLGLLYLAQALAAQETAATLSVVSTGLHAFGTAAPAAPEKALLLGPVRVIPREFPQIRTRSIDVLLPEGRGSRDALLAALTSELKAEARDAVVVLRPSGRWVQAYQPVPLGAPPATGSAVRQKGVYLITGGLGGIGLALAEHFARTAQAKLILVGRTGLPERSRWPQLIAEGDPNERRLRKVLDIEGCGGEVLVLGADVTSLADMQHAVELGRARFGAIHGVIHSAGLIDDGLISLKTAEAAARVLSVKTKGALVLEAALGREKLDFFVVFSSVSSVLGLEGQVDYTAANAFLDAFAERKTAEGDTLTVAIGWNAWRETGMAVALAEQPAGVELTSAGAHPCLERIAVDDDMQTLWVTAFSRTKHWLLSEHVVRESNALIPGTGYLELARAGLQHHVGGRGIELQDVTFLSPFVVGVGEARELRLRISRAGADQGEFRFYSDAEDEPHVTGRAAHVEEARPEPVSLAALRARCALREQEVAGILPQHFMDFGARWANVERIHFGVGEALVSLALPPAFHAELSSYPLHPALMDMATGGAQVLVEGFEPSRDFFVPFAYGRVRCHAPLTPRCFSHVRHKPSSSADIALFDATVYDPDGQVLVEVLNFMMKRVVNSASLAAKREASSVVAARTDERPASLQARVGGAVRLGISTAEGVEAFERILAARIGGPIVASSVNLHDWLAEVEERARPTPVIEPDSASSGGGAAFARPSLSRQFVMPRNEVERGLAAMWRELLGVSEVGVHDDFFELGGTSLVALRLFNKIRKTYGVSLPLSTLFEAPNIEGCAKIVAEELGIELRDDANDPSPSPSSSPNAESAANDRPAAKKKSRWPTLVVMQPKGTPPAFFCIAGLGGNLNNLRKLAILAGDERPVYGLQPPGADDPSKLLYSVPDLAEHYLREVRAVQPRGPYFLGGYSGGGIAAFEMCHRLTAAGEEVAFLGLIDSYSPELPMRSKAERARMHLERLTSGGPSYVLQTLERRANYERYELRRRVSRTLRRVFPDRFRFEQVEDSWLVAQAAYKPPPWAGRATLFRARELGSMSLWTAVKDDDEHGWGRYLLAGVDVQLCPGDHNTMCEEPNVRVLAGHLRDALRRASAKAP